MENNNQAGFDPMTGKPIGEQTPPPVGGFDPMTGKPIGEQTPPPVGGFDPMTGKALGETTPPPAGGFDPMTGKPIGAQTPPPEGGFDPMTGKPIGAQTPPPEGGFDPMTGKPIGAQTPPPVGGFDPMTGKPIKKKRPVIIPVIIAFIAVVGIAAGLILSGVLGTKHTKIALAALNTVKDGSKIYNDLKIVDYCDWVLNGTVGANISGDIDSVKAESGFSINKGDAQLYVTATAKGIPDISASAVFVKDRAALQVPFISNDVISYNYRESRVGALEDYIDIDTIETVDEALVVLRTFLEELPEIQKDNIYIDAYKKLKITNLPSKKLEINEKEVSCKGYKINITSDFIEDLIYEYQDNFNSNLEGVLKLSGSSLEFDNYFKSLRRAARYSDDYVVSIYIYKNMLAGIELETDRGDSIDLLFKGGEKRMDNIELRVKSGGDSYRIRQSCSRDGKEYTYKYSVKGSSASEDLLTVKYDSSSGDMKLSSDYFNDSIRCNLSSKKDKVTLSLNLKDIPGSTVEGRVSYSIMKSDPIKMFSGNIVEIKTIGEDELKSKIDEYRDSLEDIIDEYGDDSLDFMSGFFEGFMRSFSQSFLRGLTGGFL